MPHPNLQWTTGRPNLEVVGHEFATVKRYEVITCGTKPFFINVKLFMTAFVSSLVQLPSSQCFSLSEKKGEQVSRVAVTE